MPLPVNLNRFRKSKARADKKARANENAVKFGRTKPQKRTNEAEAKKNPSVVDQHKREP